MDSTDRSKGSFDSLEKLYFLCISYIGDKKKLALNAENRLYVSDSPE